MGKKILGYWDCEYCGTKKIKGNVKSCPNCGRPVGDDIKYYIDKNDITYVKDEEVPKSEEWRCNYCGSYNRFDVKECMNCGAGRNEENKTYTQIHDTQQENETERFEKEIEEYEARYNPYHFNSSILAAKEKILPSVTSFIKDNHKKIIISLLAIIVVISVIFLLIPKERTLVITGFSWQRSIVIDKYQTVHEDDWYLPPTARLRYTREEIRSYNKEIVGYEDETYTEREIVGYKEVVRGYRDLGNGYFEEITSSEPVYEYVTKTRTVPKYEDIPVYATKYYFDIDKYVYFRTVETSGLDKSPYWPEEPEEKTNPKIGDERVSSKNEVYKISAYIPDKIEDVHEYSLNFKDWNALKEGDTINCKVYITGYIEII